jgi:hypothetical protein
MADLIQMGLILGPAR